ncbi:MAG: hypothetical protein JJD98_03150 [Polaromonas sp.]|nr:hypothetical protein [Polaromonas sp.]
MYASKFTAAAAAALALTTVLVLGACGKKIDDATTSRTAPAPVTSPSTTDSGAAGTPMGSSGTGGTMGSGTMGSGMTAPATGASAPSN